MKYWSQFYIPTLKESPADAEIASHKLLMRAGLDTTDFSAGEQSHEEGKHCTDFWSRLFVLEAE